MAERRGLGAALLVEPFGFIRRPFHLQRLHGSIHRLRRDFRRSYRDKSIAAIVNRPVN
jgi:hypothetical protein